MAQKDRTTLKSETASTIQPGLVGGILADNDNSVRQDTLDSLASIEDGESILFEVVTPFFPEFTFNKNQTLPDYDAGASGDLTLTVAASGHKVGTGIVFKFIADGVASINFSGPEWDLNAFYNISDGEVLEAEVYWIYTLYMPDGPQVSVPSNAQYTPPTPTDPILSTPDLVAYWDVYQSDTFDLDGSNLCSQVEDRSGNLYNLINNNPNTEWPLYDAVNNVLQFGGTSRLFENTNIHPVLASGTYTIVLFMANPDTVNQCIYASNETPDPLRHGGAIRDVQFGFGRYLGSYQNNRGSAGTGNNLMVGVMTADVPTMRINSVDQGAAVGATGIYTSANLDFFTIGDVRKSDQAISGTPFTGGLKKMAIYSRVLTAQEINDIETFILDL